MTLRRLIVLAAFGLVPFTAAAAADLQKQIDQLRDELNLIRHTYEPTEPVEVIKQVTEWVSPSGELFTVRQKNDVSPTDGSKLSERVTYRKLKFSRREAVSEKIDSAVSSAINGHVVVGMEVVGVYQNIVGAGDVVDSSGSTHSANRGAGSGQLDITLSGKPMRNTLIFVDLNSGAGPGIDGLAPNEVGLNANYLSGSGAPTIREAWVALHGPKRVLGLQLGIVDLTSAFDSNLVANDETTQFLSGSLVNSPLLQNPANGPGAILHLNGTRASLRLGVQDTLGAANDLADNLYAIAEAAMLYNFFGDGQVRVWVRQQPRGAEQPDQALGFSTDRRVSTHLSTFLRYAKSSYVEAFDPFSGTHYAINKYDWAASGGVEIGNLSPRHSKDRIGLAYGRNVLQTGDLDDFAEAYFRTVLTPNFSVSAHAQGIFNRVRSATPTENSLFSLGLRTQLSY